MIRENSPRARIVVARLVAGTRPSPERRATTIAATKFTTIVIATAIADDEMPTAPAMHQRLTRTPAEREPERQPGADVEPEVDRARRRRGCVRPT